MNGYLQIELNGQAVGLKFAYPAIKYFGLACIGKTDIYFGEGIDGGFTVEGFAKLIECAYKNNCLIKEVEPTIAYEAFHNFVEEAQETEEGLKVLVNIVTVYAESSVAKKVMEIEKKSQLSL